MENTMLNQTQPEKSQNSMGGMPGQEPEHHKSGKGVFIAILIIVIAVLLGYWFFTMPKETPEIQPPATSSQDTSAATGAEANISAAEEGLDELMFDGVSEGL